MNAFYMEFNENSLVWLFMILFTNEFYLNILDNRHTILQWIFIFEFYLKSI
jgi:hypothetical protein